MGKKKHFLHPIEKKTKGVLNQKQQKKKEGKNEPRSQSPATGKVLAMALTTTRESDDEEHPKGTKKKKKNTPKKRRL